MNLSLSPPYIGSYIIKWPLIFLWHRMQEQIEMIVSLSTKGFSYTFLLIERTGITWQLFIWTAQLSQAFYSAIWNIFFIPALPPFCLFGWTVKERQNTVILYLKNILFPRGCSSQPSPRQEVLQSSLQPPASLSLLRQPPWRMSPSPSEHKATDSQLKSVTNLYKAHASGELSVTKQNST